MRNADGTPQWAGIDDAELFIRLFLGFISLLGRILVARDSGCGVSLRESSGGRCDRFSQVPTAQASSKTYSSPRRISRKGNFIASGTRLGTRLKRPTKPCPKCEFLASGNRDGRKASADNREDQPALSNNRAKKILFWLLLSPGALDCFFCLSTMKVPTDLQVISLDSSLCRRSESNQIKEHSMSGKPSAGNPWRGVLLMF